MIEYILIFLCVIGMILGIQLSGKISAKDRTIKEQNDDVVPWGDGLTIGGSVFLGLFVIGMIAAIAYPGSSKVAMTTFSNNKTLIAFVIVLLSLIITIGSFITDSKNKTDDEKHDLYVKLSFYLTLTCGSILFFIMGGLLYNKSLSENVNSGIESFKSGVESTKKSLNSKYKALASESKSKSE